MQEAKQMTTVQTVGAASHTPMDFSLAVRVGRKPVSSRSSLCLNETASSFSKGGVFECSSRVMRKYHARFLEGWAIARSPGYSALPLLKQKG
jgi:hypothetical protein